MTILDRTRLTGELTPNIDKKHDRFYRMDGGKDRYTVLQNKL